MDGYVVETERMMKMVNREQITLNERLLQLLHEMKSDTQSNIANQHNDAMRYFFEGLRWTNEDEWRIKGLPNGRKGGCGRQCKL